MEVLLLLLILL